MARILLLFCRRSDRASNLALKFGVGCLHLQGVFVGEGAGVAALAHGRLPAAVLAAEAAAARPGPPDAAAHGVIAHLAAPDHALRRAPLLLVVQVAVLPSHGRARVHTADQQTNKTMSMSGSCHKRQTPQSANP